MANWTKRQLVRNTYKFNHRRLMEESQTEDDEFEDLTKRIEKKNKLAESCGEDAQ